jgi:hypothetical protein
MADGRLAVDPHPRLIPEIPVAGLVPATHV